MCEALPVDGTGRRRAALRQSREPARVPRAPARDARGRLARHPSLPRPGPRARRPVPARVDERDLRRPARAPAARDLLGQREPRGPAVGLRRGEALRRDAHDGVPPRRTASTRRSCASSTPTGRCWLRPTVGWCRTSSCRRWTANRSRSTATATRPVRSATSTTRSAGSSRCSTPTAYGPMNIGNPDEFTDARAGAEVLEVTGSTSEVVYEPLPTDDPTRAPARHHPGRAGARLGARTSLREGLARSSSVTGGTRDSRA